MGEPVEIRVRPIKVIAEVLAVAAGVWIIISIAGPEWVDVKFHNHGDTTWNWGLWITCNEFEDGHTVCMESDWITVCLVFSIISFILSMAASICGILGLFVAASFHTKRMFYLLAGIVMFTMALLELMVAIIFPIKFGEDILGASNVKRWDFDWTYGFAWGSFIFGVGSAGFFLLPSERRENPRTTCM
ncbi:hypothetical protein ACJMK2_011188 [Sinanodonta woodiana]|uniref:Uncharacterized protein n=1 Tax=Sinanodonta woodiana TaxID=1069815 RepID=A0ABD3V601_SINWO